VAREDLIDFGNPWDAQRRDLEGKFIDGPKPVGLLDVADRAKPKGVEALGTPVDARPAKQAASDLGSPLVLAAAIAAAIIIAVLAWTNRPDDTPATDQAPVTTIGRVIPGQGGRYFMTTTSSSTPG
jgi:hypothetical protein